MAIGTIAPAGRETQSAESRAAQRQLVAYDRYIESHIRRTRRQVKFLDVAGSLMSLASASLAYLVLMALIDQWMVAGGLPRWGRAVAFAAFLAGVAAFIALRLLPLVMRRVNPVFAAHAIEVNRPNLKNGLINFLLLRTGAARLSDRVYAGMELQAAHALAAAPVEVDVDRTAVIRLLLVLVAVTAATAVYAVASPKSLFISLRRVIEPWANLAAATRVQILDVRPGVATACHGQRLSVSAEVTRLRPEETVLLIFSTLDGQIVRRSTPMTVPISSYRFEAPLPDDQGGLQQDLEYWIEAGDAISPPYRITVDPAPAIVLEEVKYTYPAYTGMPTRVVERNGDLQALDGTHVALRALANQPIKDAEIDFDCDGHNDLAMKVDGKQATINFPLRWNSSTREAEHTSYQLRFSSLAGQENPEPIRYAIEVSGDLPPKIEVVEPQLDPRQERTVPGQRPLSFAVRAVDPDFKLSTVTLHFRRDGLPLSDELLLTRPHSGPFVGEYSLDLAGWKLKPGEPIEVWASADDNRTPQANHAETPHYRLRLAAAGNGADQSSGRPDARRQQQLGDQAEWRDRDGATESEQAAGADESSQRESKAADQKSNADDERHENPGQNAAASSRDKESPQASNTAGRLDPQEDTGKAIAEIQKFFQEEKQKSRGDTQRPSSAEENNTSSTPQSPEQKSPEHKPKPSPTDAMSEGGPQARNAEQSTAGKKQDGQEETVRQSAENQGGDNSAAGDQQDNVGSRSSGGSQKDTLKPGTPDQKGGATQQPQAKFQRGMKRHDGGQSGESEKPRQSGVDDRPGDKVEPHRGDAPMPGDLGKPSTSDASGERHQGENSHRRGGMSGEESSRHQPQKQMPDGVSGKGEQRPKNEAAAEKPQEMKAKLGDDMPKNADGLKAPKPGQGENVAGFGNPNEKENADSKENFDDYKGGDPYTNDKGDAGAGEQGTNHKGSPPPMSNLSENREKKQISPDGKKPDYEDEPDAPAKEEHTKQTDSKSNMKGDRQGGGKSGGGQRSENQGTGSAGQNTASNQGGGQSDQQGGGPTGTKGGDRTKANQPTGGKPSGEQGSGSHRQAGKTRVGGADNAPSPEATDPSGHSNDAPQQLRQSNPPQPQALDLKKKRQPKPPEPPLGQAAPRQASDAPPSGNQQNTGAQPGQQAGGGNSNPSGGGIPGPDSTLPRGPVDDREPGGEEANLDYARQATNLAIDRLKDQVANGALDPALLERMKWTPADVKRLIAQWDRLKRLADESGSRGDVARQQLDDVLRHIGLQSKGSSLPGGRKQQDDQRKLRQGRRTDPPAEYAEQWFEFNKARQSPR